MRRPGMVAATAVRRNDLATFPSPVPVTVPVPELSNETTFQNALPERSHL